jgi:hypothetical protein
VSHARKALPVGLLVALALAGAGCGEGDDTTSQPPPPVERAQRLPKLPKHWRAHRDQSIGYAIGKPPGWEVTRTRTDDGVQAALIRSPDHLLAVTLVATRDPEALSVPLEHFATSALAGLPGFRRRLEPSTPRPFPGTPLDAVQTMANGITKQRGIHERATLLVLRRDGIVNYTVAAVENARRSYSARDRAVALRMIRTLRDQPVGSTGRPESG